MSFRDERDAQQHRLEQLEQALEDAREERDAAITERDEARADLARTDEERAARTAGHAFAIGAKVYVEWRGQWWKATVSDTRGPGQWLVHYEGWARSWDEVVGPARIVARTATPPGPLAGEAERRNAPVIVAILLGVLALVITYLLASE